jgi:ATP-binding cassette subfamily B protein/subfamily B ATP-binding cassette protein MsbA
MTDRSELHTRWRSSRRRYREFVHDYKTRTLDEKTEADATTPKPDVAADKPPAKASRRELFRSYLRWLSPHRGGVAAVLLMSLVVAGLEMIEPLFMRFIVDRVLLDTAVESSARPGPRSSRW